jgi:GNAT superfamily N-acetyltransferase
MSADSAPVDLSAIDEERFGVRIARAPRVARDRLPSILEFCRGHAAAMLIARCPVSDLPAAQAMEQEGFRLMDTLVYYTCALSAAAFPTIDAAVSVRSIRPGEAAEVVRVAAESFRGYQGHYHADPRLDPAHCDAAYASWAERSCASRELADDVLVADLDGRIAGFHTLRCNSREETEWVLGGVAPWARGRGVYQAIMVAGLRWGIARGVERMIISTAIANIAVQKVWTRLGFEPTHAFYTFHKWFDAP